MDSDEAALAALTHRMAELGARDPDSWARSEVRHGIAQQARFLVLRRIWARALAPWRDEGALRRSPALAQLLDQGTDQDLLAAAVRQVVFSTVDDIIMIIDEGCDPDAPDDAPGWALMETGSDASPTGRDVGGLHESILKVDPTAAQAADFQCLPGY
jgi:hypothetical protein